MLPIVPYRKHQPTLFGMGAVRENPLPWKHTVALYKPGVSEWGGFVIGTVVTEQPINDWCIENGYELIEQDSSVLASSHERTTLS